MNSATAERIIQPHDRPARRGPLAAVPCCGRRSGVTAGFAMVQSDSGFLVRRKPSRRHDLRRFVVKVSVGRRIIIREKALYSVRGPG